MGGPGPRWLQGLVGLLGASAAAWSLIHGASPRVLRGRRRAAPWAVVLPMGALEPVRVGALQTAESALGGWCTLRDR